MSEFSTPVPTMLPKSTVYDIAEDIALQLNYGPGDDLKEVVSQLGGTLHVNDLWDGDDMEAGSIEIDSVGVFRIFVSALTHPLRDRFTVAHEIGHYILHYVWPIQNGVTLGRMRVPRFGSDRLEWEANWFAAAFLMPRERFLETLRQNTFSGNTNYITVARSFNVSPQAAKVRAKALGWTL